MNRRSREHPCPRSAPQPSAGPRPAAASCFAIATGTPSTASRARRRRGSHRRSASPKRRSFTSRSRTSRGRALPAYEADDGPLTTEQLAAIDRLVPQGRLKPSSETLLGARRCASFRRRSPATSSTAGFRSGGFPGPAPKPRPGARARGRRARRATHTSRWPTAPRGIPIGCIPASSDRAGRRRRVRALGLELPDQVRSAQPQGAAHTARSGFGCRRRLLTGRRRSSACSTRASCAGRRLRSTPRASARP